MLRSKHNKFGRKCGEMNEPGHFIRRCLLALERSTDTIAWFVDGELAKTRNRDERYREATLLARSRSFRLDSLMRDEL